MTGAIVDTVMNLSVFAYIGFLVWLVFRKI